MMKKLGPRLLPLCLGLLLLLVAGDLALAETTGTVTELTGGVYRASVSGGAFAAGDQIILLVLSGNRLDGVGNFAAADIMYLDQKTALTDGVISFEFIPKLPQAATVFITGGQLPAPFCVGTYAGQGVSLTLQIKSYAPQRALSIAFYLAGTDTLTDTRIIPGLGSDSGQGEARMVALVGLAAGVYDLVISKPGHLTYTLKNVVLTTDLDLTRHSNPDIHLITLLCGDVNGDGFINSSDLGQVIITDHYNKSITDPGVNAQADLTGDGLINSSDLGVIIITDHYNKQAVEHSYTVE